MVNRAGMRNIGEGWICPAILVAHTVQPDEDDDGDDYGL